MEHNQHKFETAKELTGYLAKYAVNIEERARIVIEHGTVDQKISALSDIIEELRKPWRHRGQETNWRSELVLANKEFCEEHKLLKKSKKSPK